MPAADATPADPLRAALEAAIGFQYKIVRLLGRGGMGAVYLAHELALDRDVAIKVLPAEVASSPDRLERFEREARTVSSLNHLNICTLHDIGREGETDYLVMELVEGETGLVRCVGEKAAIGRKSCSRSRTGARSGRSPRVAETTRGGARMDGRSTTSHPSSR